MTLLLGFFMTKKIVLSDFVLLVIPDINFFVLSSLSFNVFEEIHVKTSSMQV